MSALALSILSETYSGKARAGAIEIWATRGGLGFGMGPVVGGLLLGVFGWSSSFSVTRPVDVPGMNGRRTGTARPPTACHGTANRR
jgi:MFS family permease